MADTLEFNTANSTRAAWSGAAEDVKSELEGARAALLELSQAVHVVRLENGRVGLSNLAACQGITGELLASAPALPLKNLGDPAFNACYGTRHACYGGAMANGISSEALVIALGQGGMLGSFGAAGLSPQRVEEAIHKIQAALPGGNYAFNLIHSPSEGGLEDALVDLYLQRSVRVVEASAFLDLSPAIVRYRAAGLSQAPDGSIHIQNRVIVKLSRSEVAARFMAPAAEKILARLMEEGRISEAQAALARQVPVADDVTVEADSGGHTDNRPLVCLLPTMLALRDEMQARYHYAQKLRVGAGGGISTPAAALAAYMMGAAYLVTGSVNQACVESGASAHSRSLLAKARMTDVMMAPAADMFEMGVRVQVLKAGTLFPMRAAKLAELYNRFESIEEIPTDERKKLEEQVFKKSLDDVWQETATFFAERDPQQLAKANANPKRKMALLFRWYLGLSSRWSCSGEPGREMDYQIWCGPAMGTFNDWVHNTYLAEPQNRHVLDVNLQILTGCAYLYRLQALKLQGLQVPYQLEQYYPSAPLI